MPAAAQQTQDHPLSEAIDAVFDDIDPDGPGSPNPAAPNVMGDGTDPVGTARAYDDACRRIDSLVDQLASEVGIVTTDSVKIGSAFLFRQVYCGQKEVNHLLMLFSSH